MVAPESHILARSLAQLGGVDAERVRALYSSALIGVLAEALAIGAIVATAHEMTSAARLGGWVAFLAGLVFIRIALVMQFRPLRPTAVFPKRWETLMLVAAGAAGLGWGATLPALGPLASPLAEAMLVLVIAVVCVLAMESLQASSRALAAFAVPALGITALTLALHGTAAGVAAAALVLLLLAGLLAVFRRRHRALESVLVTRVENERLLAELARSDITLKQAQRDEALVFDSALVGIAIVRDEKIVRCNHKLEEIFGYRRGTLQGALTKVLYRNEAEWREALEYIQQDLGNTGKHDAEREFYRRDGREIWCRYRGQAVDRSDRAQGAIWVFEDLSEAKLAAAEMLKSEEQLAVADAETRTATARLADAIECVPDAFALFDRDDRLINCNQRYVEQLPGKPAREALIGRTYEEIVVDAVQAGEPIPAEYRKDLPGWVAEVMRRHRNPGGEDFVYQTSDGRWLQLRERRTSDGGIVALRTDITELKRIEERIRHLAHHDPLTGLPNRRLLEDRMTQAFNLARRHGSRVGVMQIDLDRFKEVNDTKGHEAGDHVLREVAKRLQASVRQVDTVARHGGDEFVVVLNELRRDQDAGRVAQKIISAVAKPIVVGKDVYQVGASIGIAIFPTDGNDAETLLKQADTAMYRAKAGGRGRFELVAQEPAQSELDLG
jgi:diguanylate cyclase (GGDEF)-like protein/PAS domain S-box-containing protein